RIDICTGRLSTVCKSRDAAAVSETISRALDQDWIDKVSEQDPRFTSLLPLGRGTVFDRIDAITSMPSDSPAEGDESLLADAIAKISEYISRLEGMSLEDALKDYLGAVSGLQGEKLDALLARLGWHGRLPVTLQAAAEKIGVSRERIRQIEASVLKRLPSHSVVMPPLDKAIDLLENNAPIDTMTFEKLMVDRGLSRGPFHPRSVLEAAKLSGRTAAFKVTKPPDKNRFITTAPTTPSPRGISFPSSKPA